MWEERRKKEGKKDCCPPTTSSQRSLHPEYPKGKMIASIVWPKREVMIARRDLKPVRYLSPTIPHHRRNSALKATPHSISWPDRNGSGHQSRDQFPVVAVKMISTLQGTVRYSLERSRKEKGHPIILITMVRLFTISRFHDLAYKILPIHRISLLHLQLCNLPRVWSTDDHFLCVFLARDSGWRIREKKR